MTQQDYRYPITPPPELVEQWWTEAIDQQCHSLYRIKHLANRSAQWGADQELEACCLEVIDGACRLYVDETRLREHLADDLRATRRPEPKPPSLKEQALEELAWVDEHLDMPLHNHCNAIHTIRLALEQLDG